MAILNILDIIKCKKEDIITIRVSNTGTPSDPLFYIYDLDSVLIAGPTSPDLEESDWFYWFYDTTALTEQKHYRILIDDITSITDQEFLLYVTGELTVENLITRALGLSGYNIRVYDYVYSNGTLSTCNIRIYSTKTKLETAEDGGTDDYIKSYEVSISYDSEYNISTIESKSE